MPTSCEASAPRSERNRIVLFRPLERNCVNRPYQAQIPYVSEREDLMRTHLLRLLPIRDHLNEMRAAASARREHLGSLGGFSAKGLLAEDAACHRLPHAASTSCADGPVTYSRPRRYPRIRAAFGRRRLRCRTGRVLEMRFSRQGDSSENGAIRRTDGRYS
jgi:hypothetical protein